MHAYKSLDFFFVYNSLDAWNVYPENAINFDWLQLHLVSIYSVDDDNSDRIFSENSDAQKTFELFSFREFSHKLFWNTVKWLLCHKFVYKTQKT